MANAGHCATPSTLYLKDEAKMASNSLAMEVPCVYPPNTKGAKTKAQELLQNNRANYIAKADYSNGSEIDQIVKSILDQISLKASV
jgi:hypothetical protein